jgi:hypothetical protein
VNVLVDRIKTLHHEGKEGMNIEKPKYDQMKQAILEVLEEKGSQPFMDVRTRVTQKLEGHFDGSISWYYTTVKLDLEARGIIERVPGSTPQIIRIP